MPPKEQQNTEQKIFAKGTKHLAKHPLIYGILAFVFVSLPQWAQPVFGLFTTEPLIPWLRAKWGHEPAVYFTAPVGTLIIMAVLFSTFVANKIAKAKSISITQAILVALAVLCAMMPFLKGVHSTPVRDNAMRLVDALDSLNAECVTNRLTSDTCLSKFSARNYDHWIIKVHGELAEHNRACDSLDSTTVELERGTGFSLFHFNSATNVIKRIRDDVYKLALSLDE